MKVCYTFEDKDSDQRKHWENGYTYYLGLQEVEMLKKRLSNDDFSNDELVEELRKILVEARYYD